MQGIKVGGYLEGYPKPFGEGCRLAYNDGGLTLFIALDGISRHEAQKLKKGKVDFAVFEAEGLLFLVINIPGVMDWSDAPFHIGLYPDRRKMLEDIPNGSGLGLTMIGLEASNSQVTSLRFIGLGTDISREIIRIVRAQGPLSQAEYAAKIQRAYRQYTCDQMANKAIIKYRVGEQA